MADTADEGMPSKQKPPKAEKPPKEHGPERDETGHPVHPHGKVKPPKGSDDDEGTGGDTGGGDTGGDSGGGGDPNAPDANAPA